MIYKKNKYVGILLSNSILLQESKPSHNTCSIISLGLSNVYLENNSTFLLAFQMSSKDALRYPAEAFTNVI